MHVEQWIMGDPSSDCLHKQYVFAPLLVAFVFPGEPLILTFSLSSLRTAISCAWDPVLVACLVLMVVVRVDIVGGEGTAREKSYLCRGTFELRRFPPVSSLCPEKEG